MMERGRKPSPFFMTKIGIKLKRSLGQNFLQDVVLSERIVDYLRCHSDLVLEIGPGNGALTEFIVKKNPKKFHIVELDSHWAGLLAQRYKETKTITIFQKSILDHPFEKNLSYSIIGNIPYNITFPILMKIVESVDVINEAVIMMQEEVAQKLIKKKGADYGPISILMQIFFDIELCDFVPPAAFIPAPAVNSRVVYFKKKKNPDLNSNDIPLFKKFLSYFFVFPRKKIKSQNIPQSISSFLSEDLKELRAQEISPERFISIYYKK
jgi:16S rRNA (adenine1518-N6/adenine1519-N6)-dimethyltransferase